MEIADVRVENQLKTTALSSVPLEMSNVGIRVFDVEGDQTISDSLYPFCNVADVEIIDNLRLKSKQKLPGTLPTCELLENSYCVNTGTADKPKLVIYPSKYLQEIQGLREK